MHPFLDNLKDNRIIDGRRIAVVVAHPDDEAIGAGAQLPRLPGITLVHITDGAPRNGVAAARLGFSGPAAYAQVRRKELLAALEVADVRCDMFAFGVRDQEALHHLVDMARRLSALFIERDIEVVLTHAYEGGHPDHDATAFGVHAAVAIISKIRRGKLRLKTEWLRRLFWNKKSYKSDKLPIIIEMPLYRAGQNGAQTFLVDDRFPELTLLLDDAQIRLKQMIFNEFESQGKVAGFPPAIERFRLAPPYDFSVLPNDGNLLYEGFGWGITGEDWLAATKAAQFELFNELGSAFPSAN